MAQCDNESLFCSSSTVLWVDRALGMGLTRRHAGPSAGFRSKLTHICAFSRNNRKRPASVRKTTQLSKLMHSGLKASRILCNTQQHLPPMLHLPMTPHLHLIRCPSHRVTSCVIISPASGKTCLTMLPAAPYRRCRPCSALLSNCNRFRLCSCSRIYICFRSCSCFHFRPCFQ